MLSPDSGTGRIADDVGRGVDSRRRVGALALVAAFFVGGWVAGRVARYDGHRNGLLDALGVVVLAAVATTIGLLAGDPQ